MICFGEKMNFLPLLLCFCISATNLEANEAMQLEDQANLPLPLVRHEIEPPLEFVSYIMLRNATTFRNPLIGASLRLTYNLLANVFAFFGLWAKYFGADALIMENIILLFLGLLEVFLQKLFMLIKKLELELIVEEALKFWEQCKKLAESYIENWKQMVDFSEKSFMGFFVSSIGFIFTIFAQLSNDINKLVQVLKSNT